MADLYDPPPIEIEGYDPLCVAIQTRLGTINGRLHEWKAPRTVRNFVGLATGRITGTPFYDGLCFHRVIRNFMVQTGCPIGDGTGDAGYAIECEFGAGLRHTAGAFSMANAGPNTGGSQFFITESGAGWLDRKHAVFGQVLSEDDLDIVRRIMRVPVDANDKPVEPVLIESLRIFRQAL